MQNDSDIINNLMIPLNEHQRRQAIIDFINKHQGCTATDVERGQTLSGHVTTSKIIKELKKEKVVIEKRSKPRSRNIKLFINGDNYLVIVPRELDEFGKIFIPFLDKLIALIKPSIRVLNTEIDFTFSCNKEKRELENKRNPSLTPDEDSYSIEDPGLHNSLEELSLQMSTFVKAIQLLNEFIRVYTISSVIEWPRKINDKESLNKLLFLTFNKISALQIRVIDKISPTFGSFFDMIKAENKMLIDSSSIDLTDMEEYYTYFGLKDQVKPVLNHIRKIRGDLKKSDNDPFCKLGIISPFQVGLDAVREFNDPEAYYKETIDNEDDYNLFTFIK